jgi:glycosyltransferase XagB
VASVRDGGAGLDRAYQDPYGDALKRPVATAFARLETVSSQARRALNRCPEVDCLRHRLPPAVLVAAERRALDLDVGAEEVLIAEGHVSPDGYYRTLATSLGLRFANLDSVPRDMCPVSPELLLQAARGGILPLTIGGELAWAVAPRGLALRRLVGHVRAHPHLRQRVLITSPQHLARFVRRHEGAALGWEAGERLRATAPLLSAGARSWGPRGLVIGALAALAAAFALAPWAALLVLQVLISVAFLAWSALRVLTLIASWRASTTPDADARILDGDLPVYTIIVALYREAASLPRLVASLRALDYPPEKLDVLLVLEPDDPQTRAAADLLRPGPPFDVVVAPPAGPRTKPKALNAALPFARGALTVVFDAEDEPEPDQLRRAATAFAADRSGRLACLQARLTIDNTDDGWLAQLFTAEYAGLFDVLLPGLAARGLPIPLGGSSNHFRTDFLRAVGGWDAHNVTEDADLGTRLVRAGYRVQVLASSTYEEAPNRIRRWLPQRTRWLKGWMQTWSVHMRRPLALLRELGLAGFLTFQLLFIGTVLAALLQPIAWLLIAIGPTIEVPAHAPALMHSPAIAYGHWAAIACGYTVSIVLALAGLYRRRLLRIAGVMPMMLFHWVLLSAAAWWAVVQLLRDPYRWDKTEHGLGRTSRRQVAGARKSVSQDVVAAAGGAGARLR